MEREPAATPLISHTKFFHSFLRPQEEEKKNRKDLKEHKITRKLFLKIFSFLKSIPQAQLDVLEERDLNNAPSMDNYSFNLIYGSLYLPSTVGL